jgi:small subunit ribosomal protein S29
LACRDILSSVAAADAGSVLKYLQLQRALLPEAFPDLFRSFHAPAPSGKQRGGGCLGLQHEMKATGLSAVMYRQSMHDLRMLLEVEQPAHVLLRGPGGSGKSIGLVTLVDWARSKGWCVGVLPVCLGEGVVCTGRGFEPANRCKCFGVAVW